MQISLQFDEFFDKKKFLRFNDFSSFQTKTIISMPQPNGSLYTFGRDVNILWRHGIPQVHPDKHSEEGRISIIAWGWIDMEEV